VYVALIGDILVALSKIGAAIWTGKRIDQQPRAVATFSAGEAIHTENCQKYDVEEFQILAAASGFAPVQASVDDQRYREITLQF
jgi:uncharacterized SAM-dependent methyltransferase